MPYERVHVNMHEYRQGVAQLVIKAAQAGISASTLMHDTTRLMGYFKDGGVDVLRTELSRLQAISDAAMTFVLHVEAEGDASLSEGARPFYDQLSELLGRDLPEFDDPGETDEAPETPPNPPPATWEVPKKEPRPEPPEGYRYTEGPPSPGDLR